MNQSINDVVVVGGGTAGWITAGRIAAMHGATSSRRVRVTLVESPTVPIVGVGEGTWPTMRSTLMKMGIKEDAFIRECDVTFKQGAKFVQWAEASKGDFYYHPLVLPQGFSKVNLSHHWQRLSRHHMSFSDAVCFQEAVCERGLGPKTIRHAQYDAVANYAYHLNAGKFSQFLQKHCVEQLGVTHVLADVTDIASNAFGDISALNTATTPPIKGDLFIDCTGFMGLLIHKHYGIPLKTCNDILFVDTALALHVPYERDDAPIASHTISTAQEAGWIWDIGLQQRRGVGHVYASQYSTDERAYDVLQAYVGKDLAALSPRKITFESGYREKFWHRNCVAVGLSAGFVEPLEASSLVLVELSAQMIAEQLPACRSVMDVIAKRFNQTFSYRWERIIDFLKLHYVLSRREEPFWRDNRAPHSVPDSLAELLHLWQFHPPYDYDFTSNNEVFPAASYQYVLYGMGFQSDLSFYQPTEDEVMLAKTQFDLNRKTVERAIALLPDHRELINKICQYGLHSV